jgi:hypothetical protein
VSEQEIEVDDLPEQIAVRMQKRERLNQISSAYPVSLPITHTIEAVRAHYPNLEADMPAALSLSRALFAGEKGTTRQEVLALARAEISPEAKLEYLELVDADSFEPTEPGLGLAALIVAARVGEVRLIDNVYIDRKS